MSAEIFPIGLSIDRFYIIRERGPGAVMVDAGIPKQVRSFERQIRQTPVRPEDINLIVLTHGHLDHAGSVAQISAMTGAPVAAHRKDADIVEGRRLSLPTPRNAYAGLMKALLLAPAMALATRMSTGRVDILVNDEGMSLEEYGVAGRVVYTPGHTAGSLSVVLDNGDAFVGCLAHSGPPFRLHPDLPIYADDMPALLRSWDVLLQMGIRRVFPGHGRPFAVEEIMRPLEAARRRWRAL